MPVEYWNPVAIYYDDLEVYEFHKVRQEIIAKLKPEMFNETTWNDLVSTTNQTTENIISYLNLHFLDQIITNHVNRFVESLPFLKSLNRLFLTGSWINKTHKYGFQNTHNHVTLNNKNVISGVYYYDYYQEDGNSSLVFALNNHIVNADVSYQYVPGRIIIFHGQTPHFVTYNQSEKPRTSLSFNFSYE